MYNLIVHKNKEFLSLASVQIVKIQLDHLMTRSFAYRINVILLKELIQWVNVSSVQITKEQMVRKLVKLIFALKNKSCSLVVSVKNVSHIRKLV